MKINALAMVWGAGAALCTPAGFSGIPPADPLRQQRGLGNTDSCSSRLRLLVSNSAPVTMCLLLRGDPESRPSRGTTCDTQRWPCLLPAAPEHRGALCDGTARGDGEGALPGWRHTAWLPAHPAGSQHGPREGREGSTTAKGAAAPVRSAELSGAAIRQVLR